MLGETQNPLAGSGPIPANLPNSGGVKTTSGKIAVTDKVKYAALQREMACVFGEIQKKNEEKNGSGSKAVPQNTSKVKDLAQQLAQSKASGNIPTAQPATPPPVPALPKKPEMQLAVYAEPTPPPVQPLPIVTPAPIHYTYNPKTHGDYPQFDIKSSKIDLSVHFKPLTLETDSFKTRTKLSDLLNSEKEVRTTYTPNYRNFEIQTPELNLERTNRRKTPSNESSSSRPQSKFDLGGAIQKVAKFAYNLFKLAVFVGLAALACVIAPTPFVVGAVVGIGAGIALKLIFDKCIYPKMDQRSQNIVHQAQGILTLAGMAASVATAIFFPPAIVPAIGIAGGLAGQALPRPGIIIS